MKMNISKRVEILLQELDDIERDIKQLQNNVSNTKFYLASLDIEKEYTPKEWDKIRDVINLEKDLKIISL